MRKLVWFSGDTSGLTFGLDRVTPVTWRFGNRAPKRAPYVFGLAGADQAKVAAMPVEVCMSFNALKAAIAPKRS